MQKNSQNQNGFTGVSVILIIIVLAAVGAIGYMVYSRNKDSKPTSPVTSTASETDKKKLSDDRAEEEVTKIRLGLEMFFNQNGYYPNTLNATDLDDVSTIELVDEYSKAYEYIPVCSGTECTSYTLKYKYYQTTVANDTDNDGYLIEKSLNF